MIPGAGPERAYRGIPNAHSRRRGGDRVINTIEVADQGGTLTFTFEDLMRYHGPGSPGGVAHALKVLELSLPVLAPDELAERREIEVRTAFAGPGARDAFE